MYAHSIRNIRMAGQSHLLFPRALHFIAESLRWSKIETGSGMDGRRGELSGFRPVKYPCIHLPVKERERERPSFQRRPTSQQRGSLGRILNGHAHTTRPMNQTAGRTVSRAGGAPFYIPGWPGSTWAANKRGIPTATGRGVDTCPLKERRDFRSAVNRQ